MTAENTADKDGDSSLQFSLVFTKINTNIPGMKLT